MSKYQEMQTVLSEERFLVEALRSMGYAPEVSSEGVCLYGYEGGAAGEGARDHPAAATGQRLQRHRLPPGCTWSVPRDEVLLPRP
jgi:hypothetical protein